MAKSSTSYRGPNNMTKDEFNAARRKHVYPKESEVTGTPLNFIKVHSPEPLRPPGRILREWTRCESKGKGGCKSGHLGYFIELEDGTIKHAMMMLGETCGEVTHEGEKDGEGQGAAEGSKTAEAA
ncbi:hypothetical protein PRZ48_001781 [Zasmidium cellare]|uniref:Uncharacterized protein n=1 Tax=Zasmidium cellare TaxID=395010 RepID=A0ABR0F268_ZASCE|nr:hypothetical protein PRZ48_001781 [Zasmidium cellare]